MTAPIPARAGNPIADHHAEQQRLAAEHERTVQAARALEQRAAAASKEIERRDHQQDG